VRKARRNTGAEQIVVERRRQLDELRSQIAKGLNGPVTLDFAHTLLALRILEDVCFGYDPRDYFEIKHKSGPRPKADKIREILATLYFLKLRELYPDELEKTHRATVAQKAGIKSDSTLRAIIKVHRDYCAELLVKDADSFTLEYLQKVVPSE
jgi:hypothetical protein